MEIKQRDVGRITVIEIKSDSSDRGRYDDLRRVIHENLDAGRHQIVINLEECNWIDSLGLGELIRLFVQVMRQGGGLKLANVSIKVKGLLTITKLDQVFEIYEDETSAIKSFG